MLGIEWAEIPHHSSLEDARDVGGFGSGGWNRGSGGPLVENHYGLQARGSNLALLQSEGVQVIWTDCNFGGGRPWFVCPDCGRRAFTLYRTVYRELLCRLCLGLTYQSQCDPALHRLISRVQRIRVKLGQSGDLRFPFPDKPPRMHWRHYWRLQEEARRLDEQLSHGLTVFGERLRRGLPAFATDEENF